MSVAISSFQSTNLESWLYCQIIDTCSGKRILIIGFVQNVGKNV
jgi:hypothetical protein